MTKEELEKEAEEKYCKGCKWRIEQCLWAWRKTNGLKEPNEKNCSCKEVPAYLAGAEPREKRIEELEATNKTISNECHKLVDSLEKKQNEVAELQHLIKTQDRKLRQQLKVCDEAIDRVETLVKENTELKLELTKKADANHSLVEQMADLESKSAELKKQLRDKKCNDRDCPVFIKLIQANKENFELKKKLKVFSNESANACFAHNDKSKQLTKAKDALRMIIDSYNHKERFSFEKDLMKAEQFLKEVSE